MIIPLRWWGSPYSLKHTSFPSQVQYNLTHPLCPYPVTNSYLFIYVFNTQIKLRWLCEEVRERDTREQRLRKQHQQMRDQLKALRQSRDSDQAALLQRLDKQEDMLNSLSTEKKGRNGFEVHKSC